MKSTHAQTKTKNSPTLAKAKPGNLPKPHAKPQTSSPASPLNQRDHTLHLPKSLIAKRQDNGDLVLGLAQERHAPYIENARAPEKNLS